MLRAEAVSPQVRLSIVLRIKYNLSDTSTVAKVYKYKTPVVTTPLHPTHENNAAVNVART
jgi:hypothetical protein